MAAELEPVTARGHRPSVAELPDGRDVRVVRDASVAELVLAARGGNPVAFTSLYQRFHRAVHAVALARVAFGDAGDVVQDVFADAWQKLPSLREPAAFAGWLMTMARHRAIDVARRRRPVDLATVEVSVGPTPRAEAQAALAAIRALPETYRETLIMRLVEGLTGPMIAERTGLTEGSVRVNLSRGFLDLGKGRL